MNDGGSWRGSRDRARDRDRDRGLLILAIVWGFLVFAGLVFVWRYKLTPGATAEAPSNWPVESRIARALDKPTLVMVVHPRCDCTRASLNELARLLSSEEERARLRTHVVFLKPKGVSQDWAAKSDTYRRALAIPGVEVLVDEGGQEAERFGATTSGETMLFDTSGHLVFHGGITSARGHEGDSVGRSRILSFLQKSGSGGGSSPTFGCGLSDPNKPTLPGRTL
jgi:hypothetical protein